MERLWYPRSPAAHSCSLAVVPKRRLRTYRSPDAYCKSSFEGFEMLLTWQHFKEIQNFRLKNVLRYVSASQTFLETREVLCVFQREDWTS